jgi:hypothetical protein
MDIHTVVALYADNKGKLPSYAWPGGYTLFYVTANGDELCAECATREIEYWLRELVDWPEDTVYACDPPIAYGAYGSTDDYPEHDVRCDDCNAVIAEGETW